MSDTQDPGRFGLTMVTVMVPLLIVISLPLAFMTGWPLWVTSAIGGGASGLISPFIARWFLARRQRVQNRPATDTEQ